VYFSAGAAISLGPTSLSYSADIYTIVLSNTRLKNSTTSAGIGTFMYQRPGVYVVGFYGDVALVRYKEYVVIYPYLTSKPTGYVADVYLVRPSAARMQRNVIALFQDVDPTPTDNSGYSQIFNTLSSYWSAYYKWGDQYVEVDSYTVINEVQGAPQLSIGIPLVQYPSGVNPLLTAAIGLSASTQSSTSIVALARLKAYLRESYEDILDIVGRYYYPDIWHEFDKGGYRIPSIFMDLYTQPQNAR
jgi:hypothetical protein